MTSYGDGYFSDMVEVGASPLGGLRSITRKDSAPAQSQVIRIDAAKMRGFVQRQVDREPARFVPQEVKGGAVLYLPVNSPTPVAPGALQPIVVSPIVACVLQRLIISPTIAASFMITQFSTGLRNVLGGAGAIPADAFRPDTTSPSVLDGESIPPSGQILITVQNIGGAGVYFYGCFLAVRS